MFNRLSERLSQVFDGLRGRGSLSEADVTSALREVRVALLEADVALKVVKSFIEDVRIEATGQSVLKSIAPGHMVIKIVHKQLVAMLSHTESALRLQAVPPVVWMSVGLQGSGKTTVTAKLASFLTQREKRKVLMASLDVYRPAAQEQLAILGRSIDVATLPIVPQENPIAITQRALEVARREDFDVLLLDTAGRLHIDDDLMQEVEQIQGVANPLETLLVTDAMTGQAAVQVAEAFHARIGVTGIALSRMDGDARGGAALSMCAATGKPIKFLGVGEKPHQFEVFDPDRIARRMLGMGDIVGLVERAEQEINATEMTALSERMQKGLFTLDDMRVQMEQVTRMGGLGSVLSALPGFGSLKGKLGSVQGEGSDQVLRHQLAILSSMTRQERSRPKVLNASRKRRIAAGSGTSVPAVNRLLKQYDQMATAMKGLKKMGVKNLISRGFGGSMRRLFQK